MASKQTGPNRSYSLGLDADDQNKSRTLAETLYRKLEHYAASLSKAAQDLHLCTEKILFLEFLETIGSTTGACETFVALGNDQSLTIMETWTNENPLCTEEKKNYQPTTLEVSSSMWDKLKEFCIQVGYDKRSHTVLGELQEHGYGDSALLVPIEGVNGLVGIMGIVAPTKNRRWERHEMEFLRAATTHLSYAIERHQREKEILDSLAEKDVLLREVHHRVKNNMQIISSLLSMQARRISNPEAVVAIGESQNRIYSMSIIHEMLFQSSGLASINAGNYLNRLITYLANIYLRCGESISWIVDSDDIVLNIDDAIPLGLIVNELVTNSFEHAFKGSSQGILNVVFRKMEMGTLELVVGDDGVGIPHDKDFASADTMGMQMVHDLACGQLDGELLIFRENGTKVHFLFTPSN